MIRTTDNLCFCFCFCYVVTFRHVSVTARYCSSSPFLSEPSDALAGVNAAGILVNHVAVLLIVDDEEPAVVLKNSATTMLLGAAPRVRRLQPFKRFHTLLKGYFGEVGKSRDGYRDISPTIGHRKKRYPHDLDVHWLAPDG